MSNNTVAHTATTTDWTRSGGVLSRQHNGLLHRYFCRALYLQVRVGDSGRCSWR